MNSFAVGFFSAWCVLSLILFMTEEYTGNRYVKFNSNVYLIAITFPVSGPVLLVCIAAKHVMTLIRVLRRRFNRSRIGGC